MRESLADYCIRFQRQDLLSQWDGPGNAPLTPATVSYGSRQKLWWRCEQGHVWQAAIASRAGGGAGCPVCAGKAKQTRGRPYATLPGPGHTVKAGRESKT